MGDTSDPSNETARAATCTVDVGPGDREAFLAYHAGHAAYLARDIRRMRAFWAAALVALALVYVPISTTGTLVVLALGGIVVGTYGRLNRWWYVRHNRRLHAEQDGADARKLTLSLAGGRLTIRAADRCTTLPVSGVLSIEKGPAHFFLYVAPAEAVVIPNSPSSSSFVEVLRGEWAAQSEIDSGNPKTTNDPSPGSRP